MDAACDGGIAKARVERLGSDRRVEPKGVETIVPRGLLDPSDDLRADASASGMGRNIAGPQFPAIEDDGADSENFIRDDSDEANLALRVSENSFDMLI